MKKTQRTLQASWLKMPRVLTSPGVQDTLPAKPNAYSYVHVHTQRKYLKRDQGAEEKLVTVT